MLRGFCTCVLLFVLVPTAHAQDADALYREGVELRGAGRDEDALARFQRAHEIAPSGRTLAQIGFAEQALGRFRDAHRHLMEARATQEPWVTEHRQLIDESLAVVSRGLERGGETNGGLDPAPPIVLGVGAAVAIAGAILLGLSGSSQATVQHAEPGTFWTDVEGAARDFEAFSISGATLLAIGAAAVVGGAIWLALAVSGSERGSASARILFGPGYVGVAGSF